MDLACCFNKVLEVGSDEEVAEIHELAMIFVLDIDDAPSILSASNLLTIDNNGLFAADYSKWDDVFDSCVCVTLFVVELIVVVGVHSDVVEGELFPDSLLKCATFFEGERVRFCDDWYNIDNIR